MEMGNRLRMLETIQVARKGSAFYPFWPQNASRRLASVSSLIAAKYVQTLVVSVKQETAVYTSSEDVLLAAG